MFLEPGAKNGNENHLVAPTGFDRMMCFLEDNFGGVGLAA